ncbi:hypothetical protein MTO96_046786 [Rhipicephalus appendiculatus]
MCRPVHDWLRCKVGGLERSLTGFGQPVRFSYSDLAIQEEPCSPGGKKPAARIGLTHYEGGVPVPSSQGPTTGGAQPAEPGDHREKAW